MSEHIIRLDLSNSRISDNGIQKICDGISRKNRSLKDLSIKRVGLSVGGLYRVGEMIAINGTIERLSIGEDGKKFSISHCKNFILGLNQNKVLKFVELYMMCTKMMILDSMNQLVKARPATNPLTLKTSYYFDSIHEIKITRKDIFGQYDFICDVHTEWRHTKFLLYVILMALWFIVGYMKDGKTLDIFN